MLVGNCLSYNIPMSTVQTKYWSKLSDGRVQCDVCSRHCRMREGQRGLCYVRGVERGEVVLTTYGRSSGFCIDPIEKKPLNHFLPGTPVLSFGTAGCNLTCKFCQNWSISKAREFDKLQEFASPDQIASAAYKTKCKSVAYTYNDPTIFLEYAVDTAKACHERGIKNVAVTAGYICPDPRTELYSVMDAANIDLKAFTEHFYKELCTARLDAVLDTLKYLKYETSVWFEITDLLIPGENDSDQELDEMTRWVVKNLGEDVPMHFSAFHPDWKMMDKPRTPVETLLRAREIAIKNGIRYAYVGNVHDHSAQSTYCQKCGDILIGRDWYLLSEWNVDIGHKNYASCKSCDAPIAGVFSGPPGNWGRKRVPVRFKQSNNASTSS